MTFLEYATVLLSRFGVSEAEIEFILIEGGLTPGDTVTTDEDRIALKTAMYYHIPVLMSGLQNVSEGGYSISWNLEGLRLWFSLLAKELGLEDVLSLAPLVRDRSNRW